jgi:hypothetical protein
MEMRAERDTEIAWPQLSGVRLGVFRFLVNGSVAAFVLGYTIGCWIMLWMVDDKFYLRILRAFVALSSIAMLSGLIYLQHRTRLLYQSLFLLLLMGLVQHMVYSHMALFAP